MATSVAETLALFFGIMGECCVASLTGMSDTVTLIYIYWWEDMQLTDAFVLQRQSTRPCLDFSRWKLYSIHLLAEFKLSSFTIPLLKGSKHTLSHYTGSLEDGLTSTALKVTDKPFNHPVPFPFPRIFVLVLPSQRFLVNYFLLIHFFVVYGLSFKAILLLASDPCHILTENWETQQSETPSFWQWLLSGCQMCAS